MMDVLVDVMTPEGGGGVTPPNVEEKKTEHPPTTTTTTTDVVDVDEDDTNTIVSQVSSKQRHVDEVLAKRSPQRHDNHGAAAGAVHTHTPHVTPQNPPAAASEEVKKQDEGPPVPERKPLPLTFLKDSMDRAWWTKDHDEAQKSMVRPYIGLKNFGAAMYCYLNSMVQLIHNMTLFTQHLMKCADLIPSAVIADTLVDEEVMIVDNPTEPHQTPDPIPLAVMSKFLVNYDAKVPRSAPLAGVPPALGTQEVAKLITFLDQGFARGRMNDPSEAFEYFTRSIHKHAAALEASAEASNACRGNGGPNASENSDEKAAEAIMESIVSNKLFEAEDEEETLDEANCHCFVHRDLSFQMEHRWICSRSQCPQKHVVQKDTFTQFSLAVSVYPLLFEYDPVADKAHSRFPTGDRAVVATRRPSAIPFTELVRNSFDGEERRVCVGCDDTCVVSRHVLRFPESHLCIHLSWHVVRPVLEDTRLLLQHVLQEHFSVTDMLPNEAQLTETEGADEDGRKKARKRSRERGSDDNEVHSIPLPHSADVIASVTSIVVFRAAHYYCFLFAPDTPEGPKTVVDENKAPPPKRGRPPGKKAAARRGRKKMVVDEDSESGYHSTTDEDDAEVKVVDTAAAAADATVDTPDDGHPMRLPPPARKGMWWLLNDAKQPQPVGPEWTHVLAAILERGATPVMIGCDVSSALTPNPTTTSTTTTTAGEGDDTPSSSEEWSKKMTELRQRHIALLAECVHRPTPKALAEARLRIRNCPKLSISGVTPPPKVSGGVATSLSGGRPSNTHTNTNGGGHPGIEPFMTAVTNHQAHPLPPTTAAFSSVDPIFDDGCIPDEPNLTPEEQRKKETYLTKVTKVAETLCCPPSQALLLLVEFKGKVELAIDKVFSETVKLEAYASPPPNFRFPWLSKPAPSKPAPMGNPYSSASTPHATTTSTSAATLMTTDRNYPPHHLSPEDYQRPAHMNPPPSSFLGNLLTKGRGLMYHTISKIEEDDAARALREEANREDHQPAQNGYENPFQTASASCVAARDRTSHTRRGTTRGDRMVSQVVSATRTNDDEGFLDRSPGQDGHKFTGARSHHDSALSGGRGRKKQPDERPVGKLKGCMIAYVLCFPAKVSKNVQNSIAAEGGEVLKHWKPFVANKWQDGLTYVVMNEPQDLQRYVEKVPEEQRRAFARKVGDASRARRIVRSDFAGNLGSWAKQFVSLSDFLKPYLFEAQKCTHFMHMLKKYDPAGAVADRNLLGGLKFGSSATGDGIERQEDDDEVFNNMDNADDAVIPTTKPSPTLKPSKRSRE